jgi:hypothetical protein
MTGAAPPRCRADDELASALARRTSTGPCGHPGAAMTEAASASSDSNAVIDS